jgi:hypothetical protein
VYPVAPGQRLVRFINPDQLKIGFRLIQMPENKRNVPMGSSGYRQLQGLPGIIGRGNDHCPPISLFIEAPGVFTSWTPAAINRPALHHKKKNKNKGIRFIVLY